jgi:hypothetical protein
MELVGKNLAQAREIYVELSQQLRSAPLHGPRYWELIGKVQELANLGLLEATRLMRSVDLTKAPRSAGKSTNFQKILEGPRSTSFKGARRQLQADPASPNKTFGMRPHGRRGTDIDVS